MKTKRVTFTNSDGDEVVADFPAEWEICGDCQGEGKTYLGWAAKDQPAFTAEDFAYEGPDFYEDYMSGAYDSTCPVCNGDGKVLILKQGSGPLWDEYVEWVREEAHYQAICEAERRFGC